MQPCAAPLVCTASDMPGVSLCMQPCDVDADGGMGERLCSDGAACLEVSGMHVCYIGGHTAYATHCTSPLACESGTLCSPDLELCEQACTFGSDWPCAASESCAAVGGGLCRRRLAAPCSDVHACAPGLVCAPSDRLDDALCMQPCPSDGARSCVDGSVCLDVEGARLCYLGGHTSIGGGCTTSLSCEPGAVCSSDRALCERACTVGIGGTCTGSETCVDVDGGVCR